MVRIYVFIIMIDWHSLHNAILIDIIAVITKVVVWH